MSGINTPYRKLQTFWVGTDSDVPYAAQTEQAVKALESKYQIRLPEDFREYLLYSCPSDENLDEELTNWWPLERIKNIPDEGPPNLQNETIAAESAKYIFFADHMMWAGAWAICCGEGKNYGRVVFFGDPDRFVADSFADFVDGYIANWAGIAFG